MHIGIDARIYGPQFGGIGRYVQELVARLITQNDGDTSYTLFVKPHTRLPTHGDNVCVIETPIHWYTLKEQLLLPGLFAKYPVDLMHFPHWNVPLAYNKPFVVTIHDLLLRHYPSRDASTLNVPLYYLKNAAYRLVLDHALQTARHILTVSEFSKNDLITTYHIHPQKITVTHLGACIANNKTYVTIPPPAHPYFLYVGVHYPHKNLAFLCDTFMSFAANYPRPLTLVLAGPHGPCTATLMQHIQKLNKHSSKNAILYIENPTDATLGALYKNAHALVFPSLYEGFGIPPLEAQAHGIPVLASNTTAMPEILEKSALLISPTNSDEWHKAFNEVLNNENTRAELIKKGFDNCKKYSWDTCASSTHALYNKILKKEVY